jgi:arsenate reductase
MDIVITVCDQAAQEVCPIWPGRPATAHWSTVDPAAVQGTEQEKTRAFARAFHELEARLKLLTRLQFETADEPSLTRKLHEIGDTAT